MLLLAKWVVFQSPQISRLQFLLSLETLFETHKKRSEQKKADPQLMNGSVLGGFAHTSEILEGEKTNTHCYHHLVGFFFAAGPELLKLEIPDGSPFYCHSPFKKHVDKL